MISGARYGKNCGSFDGAKISPTIFGAVFESTLNPETRRKGGMHYTSIANIHKVIDPLFLNDLRHEFEEIAGMHAARVQKRAQSSRLHTDKSPSPLWRGIQGEVC